MKLDFDKLHDITPRSAANSAGAKGASQRDAGWSSAEVKQLGALAQKLTSIEIGEVMGRSSSAVRAMAARHEIKLRKKKK